MTETTTTEYQVEYGDSPAYRWCIRGLYAVALSMEIYLLWQASADDVEVAVQKEKAKRWMRAKLRPLVIARDWGPAVRRMHNQAAWIVREGANGAT